MGGVRIGYEAVWAGTLIVDWSNNEGESWQGETNVTVEETAGSDLKYVSARWIASGEKIRFRVREASALGRVRIRSFTPFITVQGEVIG